MTFWTCFKGGLNRICFRDWWQMWRSFPDGSVVKIKILPASGGVMGESGSVPGSGRCSGEGNGNSLQYSCLENSMDRGPRKATVHRVAKSWTQVKRLSTHTHEKKRTNVDSLSFWPEERGGNELLILEMEGSRWGGELFFSFLFFFLKQLLRIGPTFPSRTH